MNLKKLPARCAMSGLSILLFLAVIVGCGGAGAANQLTITTTSLPGGNEGRNYSATLLATGGQLPYNWSIVDGALPDGLSLNVNTGEISGVPTRYRHFEFTVRVVDGRGASKSKVLTIGIGVEMEVRAEIKIITSNWPTTETYDLLLTVDDKTETIRLTSSAQPITVNLVTLKRTDRNNVTRVTITIIPPPAVNGGTPVSRIVFISQAFELETPVEQNASLDVWPGRPSPYISDVRYRLSAVVVP